MVSGINIQHNLDELAKTFDIYWRIRGRGIAVALAHMAKNFSVYATMLMRDTVAPRKGAIEKERIAAFKRGEGLRIKEYKTPNPFGAGILSSSSFLGAYLDPNTQWRTKKANKNAADMRKARRSAESKYLDAMNQLGRAHEVNGSGLERVGAQAMRAKFEIMQRDWHRAFLASTCKFAIKQPGTYFSKNDKSNDRLGKAESVNPTSDQAQAFIFSWGGDISGLSSQAANGLQRGKAQRALSAAVEDTTRDMQNYIREKLDKIARKQEAF